MRETTFWNDPKGIFNVHHSIFRWRHHTSVWPTPVMDSKWKPIFSSLSSTRRGGSSTRYSELKKHKHEHYFHIWGISLFNSGMLLIVLVLFPLPSTPCFESRRRWQHFHDMCDYSKHTAKASSNVWLPLCGLACACETVLQCFCVRLRL